MQAIPETLEQLRVPVASVKPYGRNPRRGDVREIANSLRKTGQYRPIVVNKRTGEVLAGNHTLRAAQSLGWEDIAATFVDVDEDTAARIVLVDNRSNDLAGYDDELLLELLQSLPDLDGTGYDEDALDDLLGDAGLTPGKDTEAKPRPKKPATQEGDLIVLGEHRLLCGDATDPGALDMLMGGEPAAVIYTDPPYGMSYRTGDHGPIKGDDLRGDDLKALVHDSLALARGHAPGAGVYVWCTWRTYPEFTDALDRAGLDPTACIVWKKGRVGLGNADYRPEHEFCLYCSPDLEGDHELCVYCAGTSWEGGRGQSDVWEVPRDTGYVHPTQKPVALAERALQNSTRRRGVVLDVFAGSGSTLLAAENLGRRARLMELDPGYCDVIAERWARHTGSVPEAAVRRSDVA